jgi:hypothetical protein
MSSGARRRQRCTPPRDIVVRVKFTAAEKATLDQDADRRVLSLGAFIAEAAMDAAEHRAAPVGSIDREVLVELIRIRGLLGHAGSNLNQAVAKLHSTGHVGLDLAPAADWVARVADHVDDAAAAVSRQLRRRKR